jgi:5-formyltetrahydrofolate cyclo-ligase
MMMALLWTIISVYIPLAAAFSHPGGGSLHKRQSFLPRSRLMRSRLADASSSSSPSSFDEKAFETDRLVKDATAMKEMSEVATQEFAKLRTPWKWRIRKAVWDYLEDNNIAQFPRPVHHRIPNFMGADEAAENLATLPEFQAADVVKVNPDTPQRQVRQLVLENGKTLLTPQPRLRTGFFQTLKHGTDTIPSDVPISSLTSSKGAAKNGTPITLYENYTVDLVVVGSTAVCPKTGARVGKGEGFAELEWGILSQQGNLDAEKVLVVTTVHDTQVFDGGVEEPWKSLMEQQEKDGADDDDGTSSLTPFGSLTQHDVPVDIIVTPTQIIRVPNETKLPKPSGVYWDLLSPQKLAQIRVLQELKKRTEDELGKSLPSGPDEVLPPTASRKGRGGRGRGRGRGRGSGRGGNDRQ